MRDAAVHRLQLADIVSLVCELKIVMTSESRKATLSGFGSVEVHSLGDFAQAFRESAPVLLDLVRIRVQQRKEKTLLELK